MRRYIILVIISSMAWLAVLAAFVLADPQWHAMMTVGAVIWLVATSALAVVGALRGAARERRAIVRAVRDARPRPAARRTPEGRAGD